MEKEGREEIINRDTHTLAGGDDEGNCEKMASQELFLQGAKMGALPSRDRKMLDFHICIISRLRLTLCRREKERERCSPGRNSSNPRSR